MKEFCSVLISSVPSTLGMELNLADLTEVDRDYVPGLLCIRDMVAEGNYILRNPHST